MLVTMLWTALVILLALIEYMVFGMLVGSARARYKIAAPATTGHPNFERTFRVHYNTLEMLVVFIPAIWLFGMYLNPRWAAIIGAVFLVGRAIYAIGYIRAPEKREIGAMLSFASITVLVLGAVFGVVRDLVVIPELTATHGSQRTGGEALVDSLIAHGVDTVFGLPGAQTYGLFDALYRAQPGVRTIGARHEQACSYMAFGYARSTGCPAVCTVVPGPGLLNAGAGLLTAWGCNQPVLCLTGQVPRSFLDQGRGHLHEMADQLRTASGFTKWVARVEHPAQAPERVAEAFKQMRSGRPGPAVLEMPWDVFTQRAEVWPVAAFAGPLAPPPDTDVAETAARLLAGSRFPMIFVGGGAQGAAAAILELAELLDAPVVGFRSGRGIVSDAHELGLNIAAAWRLWPKTDVVLGIGTRLEVPGWRWPWKPPGQKSIRLDVDPAEMRRAPPDIALLADAQAGTRALLTALRAQCVQRGARREAIRAARLAAEAEVQSVQPQVSYLRAIRDVLPDEGIVTDEISQMGFAAWYAYPVYQPRTFISSGYQGTLGSGFPTALGVKVAHPDQPVVAICGDGGFMFAVQELATAVQYGIGVVTLVFNNQAFGNVRRDQRERFEGRLLGSDLINPDFVKLAEAFGVRAERVASPAGLRASLARALESAAPCLIEVPVPRDSEADPWRFLQPPAPI